MCMAAAGDVQGAVQTANELLPPLHHGMVASMAVSAFGTRGALAALHLTGLSLVEDAHLRRRLHQWPQAMEAVEALLAGFTQRPSHTAFSYPYSTSAFQVETGSFTAARALDLGAFAAMTPATGRAYADDLDWMAPVRGAATNQATSTALSLSAAAPAPALGVAHPEAASIGLALLHDIKSTGMQDACKYLVQMMTSYAHSLTSDQLSDLVTVMAELGMRQELPQVVHLLAPGVRGGPMESIGLLGALLTGHGPLVADVLGGGGGVTGGNAALAAARAASMAKDPSSKMVSMMEWQEMLKQVVADQAAAGSAQGMLPYFKPLTVEA